MRNPCESIPVFALVVSLLGCGGGGGGGSGSGSPAPAAGTGQGFTLQASVNRQNYPIEVYVPSSYAAGAASYPVIYALDGDANFSVTATGQPQSRFELFKSILARRGTNAILVGIGNSARRQEDYNFPGAGPYHDFLVRELIPAIDSRFRTDARTRVLTGLSTSGNLALSALFLEAPGNLAFTHFVSIEGAFHQQLATLVQMEQQMYDALPGKQLPVTVVLARSTGDASLGSTNAAFVSQMHSLLGGRNYVGLTLLETTFAAGHAATDGPAFEDAVARFFP